MPPLARGSPARYGVAAKRGTPWQSARNNHRRMKGIPDHAIERELQACAAGRIKNLKRLLFVNRKAQVIDIK